MSGPDEEPLPDWQIALNPEDVDGPDKDASIRLFLALMEFGTALGLDFDGNLRFAASDFPGTLPRSIQSIVDDAL